MGLCLMLLESLGSEFHPTSEKHNSRCDRQPRPITLKTLKPPKNPKTPKMPKPFILNPKQLRDPCFRGVQAIVLEHSPESLKHPWERVTELHLR